MSEYKSPGVYIVEENLGPRPIQGVGTAMAAFIGFSEKAEYEYEEEVDGKKEKKVDPLLKKWQLITNWTQYTERFGGFKNGFYLPHAVYGYFLNGGTRCYVLSLRAHTMSDQLTGKASAKLKNSQGKPCITVLAMEAGKAGTELKVKVIRSGEVPLPDPNPEDETSKAAKNTSTAVQNVASAIKKKERAKALSSLAEVHKSHDALQKALTGVIAATFDLEVRNKDGTEVLETVTGIPLKLEMVDEDLQWVLDYHVSPRSYVDLQLDLPVGKEVKLEDLIPAVSTNPEALISEETIDFKGNVNERSGIQGLEELDEVTMLCVPDLMWTPPGQKLDSSSINSVQGAMIDHCKNMKDRMAILDTPPGYKPSEVEKWRLGNYDSDFAALYYPWIKVMETDSATKQMKEIQIPPCGHIAGIWARNDSTRGVHKAPANEIIQGVTGVAMQLTKGEQDILNPKGVNCIRSFPGRGIRVWGARTLSNDPAWQYINVRRLFNYVEESIEESMGWVVFEPNDRKLWARVRRDVSIFLTGVWRDGALFGSTPEEAFYVKCDDELNPPGSRDLGRLIIEIGMAPVKPAEFVIFRISQWAGPSTE